MDKSNEIAKKKKQIEYATNPNAVKCLICGKKFIQVCSHVYYVHKMTAREYKDKFGLWTRGIVKNGYRERKKAITLKNGSYKHLSTTGIDTRLKKGEVLRYKRGYNMKLTQELLK